MTAARRLPPLLCASGLLAGAGAAAGQSVLFMNCRPDNVWDLPTDTVAAPWRSYHPREAFARARARLTTEPGWPAAAAELVASFDAMAELARLDADRRTALREALARMAEDVATRAGTEAGLEDQGRFEETPRGPELIVFAGLGGPEVAVRGSDSLGAIRALCWSAVAAGELLGLANDRARQTTLRALAELVAAWDAFNEAGYAQYPWELFLNRPRGLAPPRRQLVLLHPGVGVEVPGVFSELDRARGTETVVLEVLGLLLYNDRRTLYGGASLLASLPADDVVGAGLMAHLGPLKAGYVWRSEPAGEPDRDGLLLTADLLQLLTGAPAVYERARAEAVSLLERALPVP